MPKNNLSGVDSGFPVWVLTIIYYHYFKTKKNKNKKNPEIEKKLVCKKARRRLCQFANKYSETSYTWHNVRTKPNYKQSQCDTFRGFSFRYAEI